MFFYKGPNTKFQVDILKNENLDSVKNKFISRVICKIWLKNEKTLIFPAFLIKNRISYHDGVE